MTNVFDPIIVRIEDATSTPGGSSSSSGVPGGSAKGGAKGSIAGLTAGITGIAMIVSEIAGLVKGAVDGVLKPVRVLLGGILKLIAQLLRPVVDVVMLMLMPILQFLKPIIRVANEIMRPFRTLAYGFMKMAGDSDNAVEVRGLQQLAMSTIMAGIGNVLLGVSGELIKMVLSLVLDVVSFIPGVSRDAIEQAKTSVGDAIDGSLAWIQGQTLGGLMKMSLAIVEGNEKRIIELGGLFQKTIDTADEDVAEVIEGMSIITSVIDLATELKKEDTKLNTNFTNILGTINKGFLNVGDNMVTSINDMFDKAEAAAKRRAKELRDNESKEWHETTLGKISRVVAPIPYMIARKLT